MGAVRVEIQKHVSGTPGESLIITEYLLWLRVPAAGGDGILLGVCQRQEAAEAIAAALNKVLGCVHTHQAAI